MTSLYEVQMIKKLIQEKVTTVREFFIVQRKLSREFKKPFLKNIELLRTYRKLINDNKINPYLPLEDLLKTRKIRTLSGIASITVITKPFICPGHCLYCPNEKNMPKSYLANEPACMRAVLTKFDPYKQVKARLDSLALTGHSTDKIELIVLGGTWSTYPKKYQTWFIKRCFDACNEKMSLYGPPGGGAGISAVGRQNANLEKAKRLNEKAENRIIGLTLETRPDYINPKELKRMRWLGCTRVELGVQSIYNDILKYNKRGHNVETTIRATKLLKNAGFKVTYHMMLNLPKSTPAKDFKMFIKLFSSADFQPDQLKIYPCAVIRTAPLYKVWKQGNYIPYSNKQLINLLIKIKKIIPPYVRIIRIIRDIPSQSIVAGSKVSNLRQIISNQAEKICQCIRCREPHSLVTKNLKLFRQDYFSSDGLEIFLSFEDPQRKNIYAFLRLRITTDWTFPILDNSALIRELHTYGKVIELNKKLIKASQHQGLGKKLMKEAEKITQKEFKLSKITVISGIGVREYYRKLGYRLKDEYMFKLLN